MRKTVNSEQWTVNGGQWTVNSEQDAPAAPSFRVTSCTVDGCDDLAFNGLPCARCAEEIDALEAMERAKKPASRLESFAWGAGAVLLLYVFLWETRSFWIEWFDMWFGGQ